MFRTLKKISNNVVEVRSGIFPFRRTARYVRDVATGINGDHGGMFYLWYDRNEDMASHSTLAFINKTIAQEEAETAEKVHVLAT